MEKNLFNPLKKLIAEHIQTAIKASYDQEISLVEIYNSFSTPPKPELGQIAYPCFPLAKALRQGPPMIAQKIAENIGPKPN